MVTETHVWIATVGAVVLTLVAEALHARRIHRLALLAFGPGGRPAWWVRVVPVLRAACAGALGFGLCTLLVVEPKVHRAAEVPEGEYRHLVLVLDVSPSMKLKDAGPTGEQPRRERARDVIDSLFGRMGLPHYRTTVIATYNGAHPVVIDTEDSEVVSNVLADLPMEYGFRSGQTKLFDGLKEAARIARDWEPDSALLIVVSDGDTVPATGMPAMPPAISGSLVIGVGDPLAGKFIDGRQSRQDASSLRQMALRLGGTYHDGNTRHVPSDAIASLAGDLAESDSDRLGRREYALLAAALGALGLATIPWLLQLLGTAWRPGVRRLAARVGKERTSATATTAARSPGGIAVDSRTHGRRPVDDRVGAGSRTKESKEWD